MTRVDFEIWAASLGWKRDRWGHFQKTVTHPVIGGGTGTSTYRYKLSRIAVRREIKTGAGWVRVAGNYFSRLSIQEDGKLYGMAKEK